MGKRFGLFFLGTRFSFLDVADLGAGPLIWRVQGTVISITWGEESLPGFALWCPLRGEAYDD